MKPKAKVRITENGRQHLGQEPAHHEIRGCYPKDVSTSKLNYQGHTGLRTNRAI
jgi:hypothetical protein